MEAHRPGTGFPGVVIGDKSQGCGNIEGLANTHEGSCGEEFSIRVDMPGPPGDRRPGKEATADGDPSAEPIGNPTAYRAQEGIHPLELPQHPPPVGLRTDVGNVGHHRAFHRREHLAVEIIEQGNGREQAHGEPSPARESRGTGIHHGRQGVGKLGRVIGQSVGVRRIRAEWGTSAMANRKIRRYRVYPSSSKESWFSRL